MNLSNYKTLGVINRTPNSFSDAGASLNSSFFDSQLKSFLEDPTVIIDIGFESTAPMNSPISESKEIGRFRDFLEASKNYSFADRFISFDTYKVKNFQQMVFEFQNIHPKAFFIFNDVSGVLNEELKEALREFKHKKFYYIYNYSHIPDRSHVLDHMKYALPELDILQSSSNAFREAYNWFKSFKMESQLILDPGFGFSKTYEQNWQLINQFSKLEILKELDVPVLVGLSKKSFLKKALEISNESDLSRDVEDLHKKCITLIQKSAVKKLLFRVHNPSIMKSS